MSYEIKLTTVSATTTITDLGGRTFTHPTTDLVLTDEFSRDDIFGSEDLQKSIDDGDITLEDEFDRNITDVPDGVMYDKKEKSYGFMFMNGNTTTTTIGTAFVDVKVAGTTTAGELQDFTHTNNRLTYTGTTTKQFMVMYSASEMDAATYGDKMITIVYKNGTDAMNLTVTTITIGNPTGNNRSTGCGGTDTSLATDDFVELFTANYTDTTNFSIGNFGLSIVEIED